MKVLEYDIMSPRPQKLMDELIAESRLTEVVECPLCGGTGDGPVVPAVTVGEPQPAEYPPCDECGGKGYVVVDKSETEEELCE